MAFGLIGNLWNIAAVPPASSARPVKIPETVNAYALPKLRMGLLLRALLSRYVNRHLLVCCFGVLSLAQVAHRGKTSTSTNLASKPRLLRISSWLPNFGPRLVLLPKRASPLAGTWQSSGPLGARIGGGRVCRHSLPNTHYAPSALMVVRLVLHPLLVVCPSVNHGTSLRRVTFLWML